MMLETLKFHKHTTWSVYTSFFFCLFALFASRVFQTSEVDRQGRQRVTLHYLLYKKSIEMKLSRKSATRGKFDSGKAQDFSELVKAQFVSLFR